MFKATLKTEGKNADFCVTRRVTKYFIGTTQAYKTVPICNVFAQKASKQSLKSPLDNRFSNLAHIFAFLFSKAFKRSHYEFLDKPAIILLL